MKSIKGHYNGQVVVLDEPAPVEREVQVIVSFPENGEVVEAGALRPRKFRWEEAQAIRDGYPGSLSDQVIRERREERF